MKEYTLKTNCAKRKCEVVGGQSTQVLTVSASDLQEKHIPVLHCYYVFAHVIAILRRKRSMPLCIGLVAICAYILALFGSQRVRARSMVGWVETQSMMRMSAMLASQSYVSSPF